MIDKVRLKNIQSHKDSEIEFVSGINTIIGSSNNGKSAVLRGLLWAIKNRPLGTDILLSHWASDDKGNQKDEMVVEVVKRGNTVTRRRTSKENQYIVDGKVLNVVRGDVPDEVGGFFRLTDTNIQCQQDSPFLLSTSSGDVAKYFNKVVNLDIIDKVLSSVESKKRKEKSCYEFLSNECEKLDEKLKAFSDIDEVERVLSLCTNLKNKISDKESKLNDLSSSLNKVKNLKFYSFDKEKAIIEKIERLLELKNVEKTITSVKRDLWNIRNAKVYSFPKEKEIVSEIDNYIKKYNSLNDKLEHLTQTCEKFHKLKTYDFKDSLNTITKIDKLLLDFEKINDVRHKICVDIFNVKDSERLVKLYKERVVEFKSQLPELCPMCGNPMGDCIKGCV